MTQFRIGEIQEDMRRIVDSVRDVDDPLVNGVRLGLEASIRAIRENEPGHLRIIRDRIYEHLHGVETGPIDDGPINEEEGDPDSEENTPDSARPEFHQPKADQPTKEELPEGIL